MNGSSLSRHIDIFFGEIGEACTNRLLDAKKIQCNGLGGGTTRAIEMRRILVDKGPEQGCMVLLRIHEGEIQVVVTTWTKNSPDGVLLRGPDTEFPLSTPPELIAGFMLSRFSDLN